VSVTPPSDDDREWRIAPFRGRGEAKLLAGLLVIWGPLEGILLWFTAAAVGSAIGVGPQVDGYPGGWTSLPWISLAGLLLGGCSFAGLFFARDIVTGDRGLVVTADRRGIRSEQVTRRGLRRTAELTWDDIRRADPGDGALMIYGRRDPVVLVTNAEQRVRQEIADYVTARVTPPQGRRRPPVVQGWTAYVDDSGPTLTKHRETRRRAARWLAGFAGLAGVNAAAVATDPAEFWPLAAMFAVVAAALTVASVRFARTTPRWTAVPGAVVRVDRPGAEPAFCAVSLELTDREESDGGVNTRLSATAAAGRRRAVTRTVLQGGPDGDPLAEAGRWLAQAAEIPFRDLRRHRKG
jgi:hypothetical protein